MASHIREMTGCQSARPESQLQQLLADVAGFLVGGGSTSAERPGNPNMQTRAKSPAVPITICPDNDEVRTCSGVVISTTHPVLGTLYWEFVSEASVGAPDYYSISKSMERALLLEPGWREIDRGFHADHIRQVLREQVGEYSDPEHSGVELTIVLEGDLACLQADSGQSEEQFLAWLKAAEWVDVPGATRIEHLVDHGFFSEWEVQSQTFPPTANEASSNPEN